MWKNDTKIWNISPHWESAVCTTLFMCVYVRHYLCVRVFGCMYWWMLEVIFWTRTSLDIFLPVVPILDIFYSNFIRKITRKNIKYSVRHYSCACVYVIEIPITRHGSIYVCVLERAAFFLHCCAANPSTCLIKQNFDCIYTFLPELKV